MIYSQFRENDKSDRFEVRIAPGYSCVLKDAGQTSARSGWQIAKQDEAYWVDFEAELDRILQRADLDYGLKTNGSIGSEFLVRVSERKDDLYDQTRQDHFLDHDYLAQLGMVNIAEYFRLQTLKQRLPAELERGSQSASIDEAYITARTRALELDAAELSEWLVAHGIGLPDLSLFYPEAAADQPAALSKKRKKKGEAVSEAELPLAEAEDQIPKALFYVAELYRLHQATERDLLKFVDQVQHALSLETPREAIEAIRANAAPWIDVTSFEQRYQSFKKGQAFETARAQAALLRQHDVFAGRPRRGEKPAGKNSLAKRKVMFEPKEEILSPLEEFTRSFEVDEDEAYEEAMERALQQAEGAEGGYAPEGAPRFVDEEGASNEFIEGVQEPFSNSGEEQLFGTRGEGEPQFNDGPYNEGPYIEGPYNGPMGQEPFNEGPRQFPPRPRHARKRRKPAHDTRMMPPPMEHRQQPAPRGRNDFPPQNGPRRGAPVQNGPAHNGPGGKKKGGAKKIVNMGPGRGNMDFDNVQPMSNYSPGLPPTSIVDGGGARSRPGPKRQWKGKR